MFVRFLCSLVSMAVNLVRVYRVLIGLRVYRI